MDYKKYFTRQFEKKGFNEKQIEDILEIVLEQMPKEKDDALSLIRYAEKKFEAKYGASEIFFYPPAPPQILKAINNFKLTNKLTGEKYRKFIEWLMLEGESKVHRVIVLNDLFFTKLFSIFEKEGKDQDEVIKVEKKKKALSKNLMVMD